MALICFCKTEPYKNCRSQFVQFVIDDEEETSSGAKERNIAFSWMLNLSTDDIVYLEMSSGGLHAEAGTNDQAHFTGRLLIE